jgi:hypothetical protein
MAVMFIDQTARKAALHHSASGAVAINQIAPHDEIGYRERLRLISEMKPYQYAVLAPLIEQLVDQMVEFNLPASSRVDEAFSDEFARHLYPWNDLKQGLISLAEELVTTVDKTSPLTRNAQNLTNSMRVLEGLGNLDPIDSLLVRGVRTASEVMSGIAKDGQLVLARYSCTPEEVMTVLNNSFRLPWSLAMTDIEDLIEVQRRLGNDMYDTLVQDWYVVNQKHGKVHSLSFSQPLMDIERFNLELMDGHIQNNAIGCPITLVRGSLQKLWYWHNQQAYQLGLLSLLSPRQTIHPVPENTERTQLE